MTELRIAALLMLTVALSSAWVACPDTPEPRWPEQHHAGAR